MKISIFTEDSGTTQEATDNSFKEFYQGGFLTVSGLADQLSEYGDVQLHILSDRFGLVRGEENVEEYIQRNGADTETEEETLSAVLDSVTTSDIIIVLLSTSKFDSLIVSNWERIAKQIKPGSVWCLGAARSSLEDVDFDPLRKNNCKIVTYQRMGVARISTEAREELLEEVEQRQSK